MTQPSGGYLDPWSDVRLERFFETFPTLNHVVEFSCLYGDHTIELARRAKEVTVIEGRDANLAMAMKRCAEAGLTNIDFIKANVEEGVPDVGADVAFCSGLLYHLPKPWEFLKSIKTPYLYLWTHYTDDPTDSIEGYQGRWWQEYGVADPHSGLSPRSFWLTKESMKKALAAAGYHVHDMIGSTGWLVNGPNMIVICHNEFHKDCFA